MYVPITTLWPGASSYDQLGSLSTLSGNVMVVAPVTSPVAGSMVSVSSAPVYSTSLMIIGVFAVRLLFSVMLTVALSLLVASICVPAVPMLAFVDAGMTTVPVVPSVVVTVRVPSPLLVTGTLLRVIDSSLSSSTPPKVRVFAPSAIVTVVLLLVVLYVVSLMFRVSCVFSTLTLEGEPASIVVLPALVEGTATLGVSFSPRVIVAAVFPGTSALSPALGSFPFVVSSGKLPLSVPEV